MPRIAVTVDMIATGTDIKPLEIVFFMRMIRSRSFFEQMKGRGVRVINKDDLLAVTPERTTSSLSMPSGSARRTRPTPVRWRRNRPSLWKSCSRPLP
jgi:superfamily II DNA or RNA helicase